MDGIEGAARHIGERVSLYIVAKSPIARLAAWKHVRGWDHLSLISTAGNSYDADYFGDMSKFPQSLRAERHLEAGKNWDATIFNVFRKEEDGIYHFWGPKWHSRRISRIRITGLAILPIRFGDFWT